MLDFCYFHILSCVTGLPVELFKDVLSAFFGSILNYTLMDIYVTYCFE
jgi:hypothetical protein